MDDLPRQPVIGSGGGVELSSLAWGGNGIVTSSGHIARIPRRRGTRPTMYNPFLSTMMLAVEAQRVVELRMVRLAWGGSAGWSEAQSMVTEKVHAAGEAMTTLMLGGSPQRVIDRYRQRVAANIVRLSAD